jgi:hypothetical protein
MSVPADGEELTETFWIISDASNSVMTNYTLCWSWSYILEFEQPARYGKYQSCLTTLFTRARIQLYVFSMMMMMIIIIIIYL